MEVMGVVLGENEKFTGYIREPPDEDMLLRLENMQDLILVLQGERGGTGLLIGTAQL